MRQPIQVAIYCVRLTDDSWEYLMLRRIPSGGGIWQGVTGGVEDDESLITAAKRELLEETGFVPQSIEEMSFSYVFPVEPEMRKLYQHPVDLITENVFLARVDSNVDPVLDPIEHDDYKWCSFKTALEILYWPGNRESLKYIEDHLRSNA